MTTTATATATAATVEAIDLAELGATITALRGEHGDDSLDGAVAGVLLSVDDFAATRDRLTGAAAGDPLVTDAVLAALAGSGNAGYGRTSLSVAMNCLLDARLAVEGLRANADALSGQA